MSKWQPIILVLEDGKRLECLECGALAVIMTGIVADAGDISHVLNSADAWCQQCYDKAQEKMEA
jgi:hypothetical protein